MSVESGRSRCLDLIAGRLEELTWRTVCIELRDVTFETVRRTLNDDSVLIGWSERTILNVRDAWLRLLDLADWPVDRMAVAEYDRMLGRNLIDGAGEFRIRPVRISGTRWRPAPMVTPSDVEHVLDGVLREPDPVVRGIRVFLETCRAQWFRDGNKRTGLLAANHQLAYDGVGVLALPSARVDSEFIPMLLDWYETGWMGRIVDWLEYHAVGRLASDGLTCAQSDGVDPLPMVG